MENLYVDSGAERDKGENKIREEGKKVNVSAVFCILVSVVCYFEFILKSKKLITDSEDRCRLKGTRQFAIGIIFFLSLAVLHLETVGVRCLST